MPYRYSPAAIWHKRYYYAGTLVRAAARSAVPVISLLSRPRFKPEASSGAGIFPVFIIGVPRSGSTLLYQTITEWFDVAYPDNLAAAFVRNLATGMALSERCFGRRPHGCFSSRLGNTQACGFHAPAECGGLWESLLKMPVLPADCSDIPKQNIDAASRYVNGLLAGTERPLVFKNLKTGPLLPAVHQIAADARIIRIRRDTADSVASIRRARQQAATPADAVFGTCPDGFSDDPRAPLADRIVRQVLALERNMDAGTALFPQTQVLEVRFNDLAGDPEAVLKAVGSFLGTGVGLRLGRSLPVIQKRRSCNEPDNDIREALRRCAG